MRNPLATRPLHQRLTVLTTMLAAVLAVVGPVTSAQAHSATNPLGGVRWGIDNHDNLYRHYEAATGTNKQLLGEMALRPRVFWFTDLVPTSDITRKVRDYITASQDGDPNKLVHMAVFRLWPEGEGAKHKPLSLAQRDAYRRWVDNAARGIGSARVVLVLEPDLAVALQGWRPAVRLRLASYAARVFAGLPNTTIYLDAGDSDWLSPSEAAAMLRAGGIRFARGFSLGATHYAGTAQAITYGSQIVAALSKLGYARRYFVVDTSDNGRPFTYRQYYAKHPRGWFDNAEACRTRIERRCVTLGIPPTTNVAALRWGLSPTRRAQARTHVDAYLWFSRPWMVYAKPAYFDLQRALTVARTSRY
jgi:hypothetical protein